jgi:hypothetical protein
MERELHGIFLSNNSFQLLTKKQKKKQKNVEKKKKESKQTNKKFIFSNNSLLLGLLHPLISYITVLFTGYSIFNYINSILNRIFKKMPICAIQIQLCWQPLILFLAHNGTSCPRHTSQLMTLVSKSKIPYMWTINGYFVSHLSNLDKTWWYLSNLDPFGQILSLSSRLRQVSIIYHYIVILYIIPKLGSSWSQAPPPLPQIQILFYNFS